MRIGLLGGTFNPIHFGHIQMAEAVLHRLKLNRILFIPTRKTPHKMQPALPSGESRLKMVQLAIQDHPCFETCDIEINRRGPSYTIDTVRALKRRCPKDSFFFIIGTDAFYNVHRWKEPERLLELCPFVIVSRAGHPFSHLPSLTILDNINKAFLTELDQKKRESYTFFASRKSRIPPGVRNPPGARLYFIHTPPILIAASNIRMRIKSKKSVKTLLPQPVLSYIMEKEYYHK